MFPKRFSWNVNKYESDDVEIKTKTHLFLLVCKYRLLNVHRLKVIFFKKQCLKFVYVDCTARSLIDWEHLEIVCWTNKRNHSRLRSVWKRELDETLAHPVSLTQFLSQRRVVVLGDEKQRNRESLLYRSSHFGFESSKERITSSKVCKVQEPLRIWEVDDCLLQDYWRVWMLLLSFVFLPQMTTCKQFAVCHLNLTL